MFAFPILTCISGFASFGMLLLFVDEIFRNINKKIASLKEENRVLTAELKTLKSENNELVDKICQITITNDNLQTEILRIQPEEELVDENIRLVTMCGNLHKKYHMLKQELKAFDSIEITNIQLNNSFDSIITNKLTLSYP